MESDGPQKPTSPPPEAPTMSTFNPERQVSVLFDEPGSGSELERRVSEIINQLDSDTESDQESPSSHMDDGPPPVPLEEEPIRIREGDVEPVPDFPPPPPPESLPSDTGENDVTTPTDEPPAPPLEILIDEPMDDPPADEPQQIDEPMDDPPADEPQQAPPDVVVNVHTGETEDVDNEGRDDYEPPTAEYSQHIDVDSDPPESDIEAPGDGSETEVANGVHPSGSLPMYRTTTSPKRRYVQHEIIEETEKERRNSLCWCCMTLFALLSLAALVISAAWIIWLQPLDSGDTVETIAVDGDLISAEIRVTLDRPFSEELYDPSSVEYGELEEKFVNSMQMIMRETSFENTFFGTTVSGFRPGSTIVYSSLYFMPGAEVNELRDRLASEIENADGGSSLQISDVEVVEVRVTSEEDIKIPIRIFTTPTVRRGTTTRAPMDMATDEITLSVTARRGTTVRGGITTGVSWRPETDNDFITLSPTAQSGITSGTSTYSVISSTDPAVTNPSSS